MNQFKLILLLLLLPLLSGAQNLKITENGLPPIRQFTSDDYGLHPQNWAFTQDERGLIYAGNTEGVLEYDGENWRALNKHLVVLSLEKSETEKIYYGAVGDIGYLAPNANGLMEMVSLKILLEEETEIGAVQSIMVSGEEIYFTTFHTIFVYNETTKILQKINSEHKIYPSFIFNNQLHLRLWGKGLFVLNNGGLELAPNGEYFIKNEIGDVVTYGSDSVITIGGESGAHFYSTDTVYKVDYFDHSFFRENGFYKAVRISNDYYVFCFLKGGLVIVDKHWQPVMHLDDEVGFENQTHNAFEDINGNLWVGTNAGISMIELSSPVSSFTSDNGLKTAVYSVVEHQGEIFATGNAGVFYKPKYKGFELLEKGANLFRKVKKSPNIGVELLTNQRVLFSLHTDISGEVDGHQFKQLFLNSTNMASGTFALDSNTIIATSNLPDRLEIFKQKSQHWVHDQTLNVAGLPEDILLRMEYDAQSKKVWGCTFQGEVVSFGYSKNIPSESQAHHYDASHHLPDTIVNLFKLGDSLRFLTSSGVYGFSEGDQRFVKDKRFSDYFDKPGIFYMTQEKENVFWYATRYGENGRITFDPKSSEIVVEANILKPFNIKNSGNLYKSKSASIFVPTMKGMLVVDPNQTPSNEILVSPLIRKIDIISSQDTTIFNGVYRYQDNVSSFYQIGSLPLNQDQNAFRFNFSIPYFKGGGVMTYQYKLDGFDESWSQWNTKNEKEYTNIPSGDYQFMIKAKNVFGIESNVTTFNFSIAIPWYQTYWAYAVYAFFAIVFVWVIVQIYAIRLKKENQRLEITIKERTKKIQLQSEKLKELNQVKTRFFSNISHEFRTPLTLIKGPIEAILSGKIKDKSTEKENLKIAQRNSNTLQTLIDELLEFNKLETGTISLNNQPVFFHGFMEELSKNYKHLIHENSLNLALKINVEPELKIILDARKFEHILNNLISNAVKHTPENGHIVLQIGFEDQQVFGIVSDSGVGIEPDELPHIFDRFYQASHGKQTAHSTGIGLAYVKEIIGIMDGSIDVVSDLEQGTTFKFSIPVDIVDFDDSQERVADNTTPDPLPHKYKHPNNKILLVEDNHEMQNYIVQVLSDEFDLTIADNGQEAVNLLNTFTPDLVISDIMMPVMDGMALLKYLKNDEKLKYVSVIMLTAKSNQEVKLEALTLGLDDYITKPFNPIELEIRTKNILQNQYERIKWVLEEKETDKNNAIEDPLILELKMEIEARLEDSNYGVLQLANFTSMSDRQLTRVVKKSTGLTPANLIKEVKLQKAKSYFEQKKYRTIAEVSFAIGFDKPSYFSKVYFERFGKRPSEYLS